MMLSVVYPFGRQQKDGEHDQRFHSPGNGLVPVTGINSNILWKQVFSISLELQLQLLVFGSEILFLSGTHCQGQRA